MLNTLVIALAYQRPLLVPSFLPNGRGREPKASINSIFRAPLTPSIGRGRAGGRPPSYRLIGCLTPIFSSERPYAGHGAVGRARTDGRGTRGKSAGAGQATSEARERAGAACLPACPPCQQRGHGGPLLLLLGGGGGGGGALGEIFSRDDQAWFLLLLLLLRLLRFCPSVREDQSHLWVSTKVEEGKFSDSHY